MRSLALASVKHSPGVTTAALAFAAAWDGDVVVVEADPSGGDIAARVRLALEPGLHTLAASARHPMATVVLEPHAQPLPAGGAAVVAATSPDFIAPAIATVASRLPGGDDSTSLIVDCGRIYSGSPTLPVVSGADALAVLLEPTVASVEHVRARLPFLLELGAPVVAVPVGDRPYGPEEIGAALGVPAAGALAIDSRGVSELGVGRGARRSSLVRSARTVLDVIEALTSEARQEVSA